MLPREMFYFWGSETLFPIHFERSFYKNKIKTNQNFIVYPIQLSFLHKKRKTKTWVLWVHSYVIKTGLLFLTNFLLKAHFQNYYANKLIWRYVFQAVRKTRSTCFIGSKINNVLLPYVLNQIEHCCSCFKHYLISASKRVRLIVFLARWMKCE